MKYLKNWIGELQQSNQKSTWLAALRILFSLWLMKEMWFRHEIAEQLFGNGTLRLPPNSWVSLISPDGSLFRHWFPYTWYAFFALNLFHILGIGRNYTAAAIFILLELFQGTSNQWTNGSNDFSLLIAFYLIFANSYDHFVLWKRKQASGPISNLLSNLAAWSIMLNLCLIYFKTAVAKMQYPGWLNGDSMYYAFLNDNYRTFAFTKQLAQYRWITWSTNWITLIFELAFPFLIWFKFWRKPLIITGICFHAAIYIFLLIYGLEELFVMLYGLFYTDAEIRKWFSKLHILKS